MRGVWGPLWGRGVPVAQVLGQATRQTLLVLVPRNDLGSQRGGKGAGREGPTMGGGGGAATGGGEDEDERAAT